MELYYVKKWRLDNRGTHQRGPESIPKKKSPGPDEIKPVIFEHLPLKFITHLAFIYRSVILLKYTPKLWKSTKVIFIPKPGKKNYNIPKAFRSISLSNYFLKTLERLVCWKLEDDLSLNPLHEAQHGFTKNKSTESACLLYTSPSPRD